MLLSTAYCHLVPSDSEIQTVPSAYHSFNLASAATVYTNLRVFLKHAAETSSTARVLKDSSFNL